MTRIINRPIPPPTLDAHRRPQMFRLTGQVFRVKEVLDSFLYGGRWWEREPEQLFWRVLTEAGGVIELTHDQDKAGQWRVYKIYD